MLVDTSKVPWKATGSVAGPKKPVGTGSRGHRVAAEKEPHVLGHPQGAAQVGKAIPSGSAAHAPEPREARSGGGEGAAIEAAWEAAEA